MSISNRERVARGMEQLREGLAPFAEREFEDRLGGYWRDEIASRLKLERAREGAIRWDTQALLKAIGDNWQEVFRHRLGHAERAYVSELREIRNRWAHEVPIPNEDAERALDTMKRLLDAVSAGEQAHQVARIRHDLQRAVFDEQARNKTRYQSQQMLEGMPKPGLKPWREVVTPHPDVASGRYMQAEFAADLAQVHRNQGSDEYRDPIEFFRRTFITAGLRDLLVGALERLTGRGGDPVLELQTNFGGGKTHSMLALYHLFGGTPSASLPGLERVLQDAGVDSAPTARRAVLVGTDLSPAQVHEKEDGTRVRTLWGELAWQLGKKDGYALVADSDTRGVSPGAGLLADLFRQFGPCLILIDEWVAYARQIVGKRDLPAGDFEAQATFAQALTEAARAAPRTLVVASIPASSIEIGGEYGEQAKDILKNVFERLGKPWRPATADEGFEIVRRRLFEPIEGRDAWAQRDAVVAAFAQMYRKDPNDFPNGTNEEAFKRELEAAYPIHPELFRRLYGDWSTLDKFQRTRGVLRLLAKVVHRLWESNDAGLMILPAFVPMDDPQIKSELTRYLPDVWEPILAQDVDGEGSLPLEIDRSTPNLGRVSAARRVARMLFLGTAPGAQNRNPGIDDRRVRLGCVQPGETVAAFGDALRRLSDHGRYVHQDGNRYWISTKANLNRLAEDRAAGYLREPERLHAELQRRLEAEQRKPGAFSAVHPWPDNTSDVPDEPEARLVIFSVRHPHRKGNSQSDALKWAQELLAHKGNGPRLERNCLVFLAPDQKEIPALLNAVSQYLAWQSIDEEREALNLDPFHQNQARQRLRDADQTVAVRIRSTWTFAIAPRQESPTSELEFDVLAVSGDADLAVRTGARLEREGILLTRFGGLNLRKELDRHLWGSHDAVTVAQLSEWFARYPYLPRLQSQDTLINAIRDGAGSLSPEETFAIASGWDAASHRYVGLKYGAGAVPVLERTTLVVRPLAAKRQKEAEVAQLPQTPAVDEKNPQSTHEVAVPEPGGAKETPPVETSRLHTSFFGSVRLDGNRIGRDAGRIAEELVQHLSTLPGAEVEVTMEIRIRVPGGIREETERIVKENATTLKFTSQSFERD